MGKHVKAKKDSESFLIYTYVGKIGIILFLSLTIDLKLIGLSLGVQ